MGKHLLLYISKLKAQYKLSFTSTFVLGLLVHAYKFLNTLPNHDSVYNFYSSQNTISSGRWLLSVVCGFSSYYDLPWLIGLISVLMLSITAVIIISVLEIEDTGVVLLVSGLLVAFPSITETFFFEFTADGYLAAMVLAAIAVKITAFPSNSFKNYLIASVLICCVCGIYQSYVSFAMIFAICNFIRIMLTKTVDTKACVCWILRQTVLYLCGLILFLIVWKMLLYFEHANVGTNQGIGEMGLNLATIISFIPASVATILRFFLEWNVLEHGWTLYGVLNTLFTFSFFIVCSIAIIKSKIYKKPMQFLILLCSLLAIPFIACMWRLVTPGITYRPMMLGGLVMIYILASVISVHVLPENKANLLGLLLCCIIVNNAVVANISYYYMNNCYEKSYAMASEMMQKIHNLNADTHNMPLVIIGRRGVDAALDLTVKDRAIPLLGNILEKDLLLNEDHIIPFLNNLFDSNIHCASAEVRQNIQHTKEVSSMGIWPQPDSIMLIEDTIVIKISDFSAGEFGG